MSPEDSWMQPGAIFHSFCPFILRPREYWDYESLQINCGRAPPLIPRSVCSSPASNISQGTCLFSPPCLNWPSTFFLHYRDQENYEVVRKVGRGKYSEVFEGVNSINGSKCIIKASSPISQAVRKAAE